MRLRQILKGLGKISPHQFVKVLMVALLMLAFPLLGMAQQTRFGASINRDS